MLCSKSSCNFDVSLRQTIRESWDADEESRLSASTAYDRVCELRGILMSGV